MAIKSSVLIILATMIFQVRVAFSQLYIYPRIGVNKNYTTKVAGSPYLYPYQSYIKGLYDEFLADNSGFDIKKEINNHGFYLCYASRIILLDILKYSVPYRHNYYITGGSSIGTDLRTFILAYGYDFDFHFLKKKTINKLGSTPTLDQVSPQKHWINFSITPIIGTGINFIRESNWAGYALDGDTCIESGPSSSNNGLSLSNTGWDDYDCDNHDKIVKNKTGLVVYGALKLSWLKQEKERLSLSFMYYQTFQTYLEASYYAKIDGVDEIQSATFSTKGNSWSISLSYPITIVNKKEERYRDRHPRE